MYLDCQLPGSFEDLKDQISSALNEKFKGQAYVELQATFPDYVIARLYPQTPANGTLTSPASTLKKTSYRIDYSMNDKGVLELGEPTPVALTVTELSESLEEDNGLATLSAILNSEIPVAHFFRSVLAHKYPASAGI